MKASIDTGLDWYVVQTKPTCEEKAAYNLRRKGFDYYLPRRRIEKWNKRNNTYYESERPLMVGYLFVGLPKINPPFGFVRACVGVDRILGDHDNHPIPVPVSLVEEIFTDETDMQYDDTRAARKYRGETLDRTYPSGAVVLVNKLNHVLHGINATVIRTNGVDRVQISLGSLGKPWVKATEIIAA